MLPFLLPYFRVERALGGARGLGQAVYFAADLRDFLHSVDLSVLYGWSGRALGIGPSVALQYLWPGVVALGLAIWGVAGLRRDGAAMAHAARPFATLGLAAAVLCLGPFLKVWGHQTDIPLPYLLLHFLPGFAGLRDPARFGIIVTLCLALLAAYGMALLMRRYRRRAGWLAAALCAGVLAESWIRPLPTAAMPIGRALPPVYRWLAAQPAGSPVLELPAGLQNKTVWAWQAEMMLYATYHWQPIVNGTGGFTPPGYDRDAALYNAFPSPATLQLLEHRHVRFVIVHRAWVGPAVADAIARRAAAAHITRLRHWADVDVYAVPAMCVPCQVWTVHRAGYRHTRSYASS